jgi:hypothetical protein
VAARRLRDVLEASAGLSGRPRASCRYNTQADGECKEAAVPGDGSGCGWKVVEAMKYANETCINAVRRAARVERGGPFTRT